MPLTHRAPPQPVRAVHVQEVRQATAEFAELVVIYLRRLLRGLEYPRAEWTDGTGTGAGGGVVGASANQSIGTGSVPGVYAAGNRGPTASAVQGKRVMLVRVVGAEEPVRTVRGFYDGRLFSAVAAGPQTGTPVPQPQEPAAVSMEDLDDENYDEYIRQWAEYAAAIVRWLVDREWRQHWTTVTRFTHGTVLSASVAQKVARVRLEDTGGTGSAEQLCGFGSREWKAAQLVGRRVRVAFDPRMGWWVDDWAS